MKKVLLIFLFLPLCKISAQVDHYILPPFFISADSQSIKVYKPDSSIVYQKEFYNPDEFTADLDNDGVNEFVVTDFIQKNGIKFYTLYVYNTIDSFYLADSIYSGTYEPRQDTSKDINSIVLITGNTNFEKLIQDDSLSTLPVNCWKFVEGSLYLANASVYDIFINENDSLLDLIDEYYSNFGENCNSTKKIKGLIISTFINYLSADDQTVANQFLKKYYLCGDIVNFKEILLKLLNN